MAHDVVISYSRRNREIADRLTALLRERGLDVWYDRMIKPGADWRDEIANAISRSRIFLILFSAESNDSQELRKELAIADRRGLLIVPVRIEEVEPTGLFEYELARRQWFDIFADWRAGLPLVVDYIAEAARPLKPEETSRGQAVTEERSDPQPPPSPIEPAREPARPARPAPNLDTGPRTRTAWFWTAAAAAGCGFVFALAALILALAADDDEMAGGVTTIFLVPIFLLAQLPAAAFVEPAYERSRAINWLLRALPAWAIGLIIVGFSTGNDSDALRSLIAAGQVGGVIVALLCLAFVGVAARDASFCRNASPRLWILPLIGAGVMALTWVAMDGNDFERASAIIGAVGLALAGAGYLVVAWTRATPAQPVAVPAH